MEKKIAFATRAVVVNENNEILILKKSDIEDVGALEYDMPGGRMEFGETPESGVVREVREETGLDVEVVKMIELRAPVIKESLQLVIATFLVKIISGEVSLSQEHSGFEWKNYDVIIEGDYPEWIKKSIRLSRES